MWIIALRHEHSREHRSGPDRPRQRPRLARRRRGARRGVHGPARHHDRDRRAARMGRMVLVAGCAMVAAGLALTALAVHLTAPLPDGWDLAGPLLLAGLGSGMVIAPNQDFVLARVPSQEAGTAGAVLGTAQRAGSAIGVAVTGTVLFGTLRV